MRLLDSTTLAVALSSRCKAQARLASARPFRSEVLRLIGVPRIHPTEGSLMATHGTGAAARPARLYPVQLTVLSARVPPASRGRAYPVGSASTLPMSVASSNPAATPCACCSRRSSTAAAPGLATTTLFSSPVPTAAHSVARHCRRLLDSSASVDRAPTSGPPQKSCAGSSCWTFCECVRSLHRRSYRTHRNHQRNRRTGQVAMLLIGTVLA